jgi:L-amino acid N-acyltransferase YncA
VSTASIRRAEPDDLPEVIALIADTGDAASLRLHARCDFREVDRLERVGFKHDRWVDTVLMQREVAETG